MYRFTARRAPETEQAVARSSARERTRWNRSGRGRTASERLGEETVCGWQFDPDSVDLWRRWRRQRTT